MTTETTRPVDAPVRPPADMAGTDLLLHIGQSKTGTSAIQACLTLNRGHLQGMGILYPPVSIGGLSVDLGNHNALADAVTGWISFPFLTAEQHFQSVWEQARGAHYRKIILSAEHFFGGKPRIWEVENEAAYFRAYRDKVRRLSGFLDTLDVTILVYLRPQADWLSSAVNQTVKIQGLIGDRQLYRDDNQFYDMMRPLLRYGTILDIWQEAFPNSRIVAVPYVRDQLYGGSSIADFLQRIGIDDSQLKFGASNLEVNSSLSLEYLEVKKRLNLKPKSKVRERAVIRCLERLSKGSAFGSRYPLPQHILDAIERDAEAENAIVNARYVEPGKSLVALSSSRAREGVSPEQADSAMKAFEAEFSRLRYRVMEADMAARAMLRRHARPVHSFISSSGPTGMSNTSASPTLAAQGEGAAEAAACNCRKSVRKCVAFRDNAEVIQGCNR